MPMRARSPRPSGCIGARLGELGPDAVVVKAADQTGAAYDLPLAVGDRVRLFARTNASYPDKSRGIIGNNGSVLELRGIDAGGVTLRNAQGREGLVKWGTLRDQESATHPAELWRCAVD